jgi:hypothetical protein
LKRIVLVQTIVTHWSKASRGSPSAALRRRVPLVMPVPDLPARPDEGRVLHRAHFGEVNQFRQPVIEAVRIEPPDLPFLPDDEHVVLDWEPDGDGLRVGLTWRDGAPRREQPPWWWPRQAVFVLQPGEWGQVRYNYRKGIGMVGYRRYVHRVFNIGLDVEARRDVFVTTPPTRRFADRARLR